MPYHSNRPLSCCLVTKSCATLLQLHGPEPARLLCPWDFPCKNIGVGCHFLLQGIFPTQGSNPCLLCLLHWQADSSPLSHLGPSHNKLKKKNHMIISIDTKTFENIQHSFMIKTLRKLGIEKFLNLMKNIYQKTYRQHHT